MIVIKDTNTILVGTRELLTGLAVVSGLDETGEPVYDGNTEIDWDGAKTDRDERGGIVWIDTAGNTHSGVEVVFLPEHGADWVLRRANADQFSLCRRNDHEEIASGDDPHALVTLARRMFEETT